ncbi:hypothetical protein Q4521_21005, partial [Saccharophagus degradans]|nr:hypothetical protein [Saccharophagus degradans]
MKNTFLDNTSLIKYSKETHECEPIQNIEDISFVSEDKSIHWLNTYGTNYTKEFKQIIHHTYLDDFLLKLISDENHPNKVLELDNVIFVAIKVLKTETDNFNT